MTARLVQQMLGGVTCGDCIDVMAYLPRRCVDFILTDPPYLVRYRDRRGRTVAGDADPSWLVPAFAQMNRVLRNDSLCVSFYGWNHADLFLMAARGAGFRAAGHLVFRKPYASGSRFLRYEHEQAFLLAKGRPPLPADPPPDVLDGWEYTGNRLHPTQKPVGILTTLIESLAPPGAVVLDPFCGSGSTLVAAHRAERRFIGIELEAAHQRTASERLSRNLQSLGRHARTTGPIPSSRRRTIDRTARESG